MHFLYTVKPKAEKKKQGAKPVKKAAKKPGKKVAPATKGKRVATPVVPPKSKRHEKRDLARTLFFSGTRTAKEIADALDLSEQTVSKWRNEDAWDEQRSVINTSAIALIKRFTAEIENILDAKDSEGKTRSLTAGEVDQISKLSKSIKYLRNQLDPQTIMEALDGYMAYLAEFDLPLAQGNVKHAIAYVQMRMKESKQK